MATQPAQNGSMERLSATVLVIGAGLAGLATAISIQQAGHYVTILERMPEIREVSDNTQMSTEISSRLLKLQIRLALVFRFHQTQHDSLEVGVCSKRLSPTHSSLKRLPCAPTAVVLH
jgi:2-polyprenyl-6-methoxyphenol hydroxylase-like FAD-dependent oxidoreductase